MKNTIGEDLLMEKISKKKFTAFLKVQESGLVNMFNVRGVVELAEEDLTKEEVWYIMKYYNELKSCYNK